MATVPVKVKHQGKLHDVELDPTSTGETLKYQLYSLTGVEPERQKILIKGGQLKDDTDLSTLKAKAGQVFMMMGTPAAGEGAVNLGKPKEQMRFMEDMTEAEAARAEGATPAGLQNLGNTCYTKSTLQTLKSVPELQEELVKYKEAPRSGPGAVDFSQFGLGGLGQPRLDLTASLRDLYKQMAETQEGFPPIVFLQSLRSVFPQFAEKSKSGNGYAQQDAEEAWTQIISDIRQKLKLQESVSDQSTSTAVRNGSESFIDRYLAGKMESNLVCDEQAAVDGGEEPEKSSDVFLKLDCHITKDINHLRDGILAGLEEKIEKKSTVLDRNAPYTKTSRVTRLPKYLAVHFVRFFWKREAAKKAKIMRKVTFPSELDAVEFCTEALREQLVPVRDKVREIRKDEEDMTRARKRQKIAHKQAEDIAEGAGGKEELEPLQKAQEKGKDKEKGKDGDKGQDKDAEIPEVYKTDSEYEAEREASLKAAKKELFDRIDPSLARDAGSNPSGVYDLRAIITHQGASADSGHYTSYVKKQGVLDPTTGKRKEEDGKWWWFNDDKVSEVSGDKIETLSGGGESHSALILLYRAIELPTAEEVKD